MKNSTTNRPTIETQFNLKVDQLGKISQSCSEATKSTKSFEDQRPESDRSVIIFRLPRGRDVSQQS